MHFYRTILFLALLCAGPATSAEIVIRFSHIASSDSPKGLAALHFKNLAESLSRHQVRVDLYPDGQLFKDNEEMEALQLNSVQMLAPAFSKFSAIGMHEFEAFDLPYLFQNFDEVHHITQGPIGRKLLASLSSQGMVGLGYWDSGFKNMSANVPIRVPNDMRGLRMRIQPSKVLAVQMNQLGAVPFSLPFYETYRYLNNGLIDGTETPPSMFTSLGLLSSQKYLTLTRHGYLGYVVVTNQKFWDSLPTEIQVALTAAMNETSKYANSIAMRKNESDLQLIRNSGTTTVLELTPSELTMWRSALSSVEVQTEDRIGAELIKKIHAELSTTSQ